MHEANTGAGLLVTLMPLRFTTPSIRRPQRKPIDASSTTDPFSISTPDVATLWAAALEQYTRSLKVDLHDPKVSFVRALDRCNSTEEILLVLQGAAARLSDKRRGGRAGRSLRETIKPVVHGLNVILNATAETASSLVRV